MLNIHTLLPAYLLRFAPKIVLVLVLSAAVLVLGFFLGPCLPGQADSDTFYVMGVHTKSKGIFSSIDQVQLERLSRRNRLKLYAECEWIRRRVEEWLDDEREFAVMGDVNDGPGMDIYEVRSGRSAVETIMGDLFKPDGVLRNDVARPEFKQYGWEPASAASKIVSPRPTSTC